MVDTHYDLLSICYTCYLKNDYTKIEGIANDIKRNLGNIKCIFANLYFMTDEEMKLELHENYYRKDVPVLEMFKISKQILETYLPEIDFVYSIEGCDYINEDQLDELYNEGLRSIILVWNNENKYGSGYRSGKGLTKEGLSFLNKAIDLGIGIDLSHANEKTFYGMIEAIKMNQLNSKDVICYASHSNSKKLCDRKRNLTDKQLNAIKEVGGLVGVFSNKNFVLLDDNSVKSRQVEMYLNQIKYISDIVGIENVMISTDDMRFCADADPVYYDRPIYDYCNIYFELKKDLSKRFSETEVKNIMYKNVYDKVINKLKYKRFKRLK